MNHRVFIVELRDASGEVLVRDDLHSRAEAEASAERLRARGDGDVEIEACDVVFISRAEAGPKLRQHWLDTYSREELLETLEPTWSRLRNYEFENLLEDDFGGAWCINEWCPFDGINCAWRTYAPDAVIEETVERFERDAEKLKADGYNVPMMIASLRDDRNRTHA